MQHSRQMVPLAKWEIPPKAPGERSENEVDLLVRRGGYLERSEDAEKLYCSPKPFFSPTQHILFSGQVQVGEEEHWMGEVLARVLVKDSWGTSPVAVLLPPDQKAAGYLKGRLGG